MCCIFSDVWQSMAIKKMLNLTMADKTFSFTGSFNLGVICTLLMGKYEFKKKTNLASRKQGLAFYLLEKQLFLVLNIWWWKMKDKSNPRAELNYFRERNKKHGKCKYFWFFKFGFSPPAVYKTFCNIQRKGRGGGG